MLEERAPEGLHTVEGTYTEGGKHGEKFEEDCLPWEGHHVGAG